jgi:hypothetical protein
MEKINLKAEVPGDNLGGANPGRSSRRALTKKALITWIKSLNHDDHVMTELIKKAEKYPDNTLGHFKRNIKSHVRSIQSARKK